MQATLERKALATREADPFAFFWAIQGAPYPWHLDRHDIASIRDKEEQGCRFYLVEGEPAGYAIGPDGYLSLFFNASGRTGIGRWLARDAIERGARSGDCFDDGFLPRLFAAAGGIETGRVPFDPAQAPEGWPEHAGTPDVVFFEYRGNVS